MAVFRVRVVFFDAIEEFVVALTPNNFAEEVRAFGKNRSFVLVRFLFVVVVLGVM